MYNFIKETGVTNEMISILGEFSFLWAQFELIYFINGCNISKIRNLTFNISNFKVYDELCNNFINALLDYLNESKETITIDKIHNKLYSTDFKKFYPEIDDVIKKNICGKDLIKGSIFILFRLRNNMFHGLKDCYNINFQKNLFICANILINQLIVDCP